MSNIYFSSCISIFLHSLPLKIAFFNFCHSYYHTLRQKTYFKDFKVSFYQHYKLRNNLFCHRKGHI